MIGSGGVARRVPSGTRVPGVWSIVRTSCSSSPGFVDGTMIRRDTSLAHVDFRLVPLDAFLRSSERRSAMSNCSMAGVVPGCWTGSGWRRRTARITGPSQ
jgi:hypothetical protein